MKKQIWKFELNTVDTQEVLVPDGAEILTVQVQNEKPCIWALVDINVGWVTITIEIFETGNPIEASVLNRTYIGTYQLSRGASVGHVFKKG